MGDYYFFIREIGEMAQEVEEAGYRFYQQLAERFSKVRPLENLFNSLAQAELKHKETFQSFTRDASKSGAGDEYSIDLAGHMRGAFIDSFNRIVFDLSPSQTADIDLKQAFAVAIRVEQHSIQTYGKMKEVFIEKFGGILAKIIDEERRHLDMLQVAQIKVV
jgi:rubrerythrin